MSNSYAINCDFSELLSGADQKKFCFGIIHEQLVLRHPLPDVLNVMFERSNRISLARVRLGTKRSMYNLELYLGIIMGGAKRQTLLGEHSNLSQGNFPVDYLVF